MNPVMIPMRIEKALKPPRGTSLYYTHPIQSHTNLFNHIPHTPIPITISLKNTTFLHYTLHNDHLSPRTLLGG